ncbi:hypothetical protein [Devosia sp.]
MSDYRMTGGCQCGAVRYEFLARRKTFMSAIAACARRLWAVRSQ